MSPEPKLNVDVPHGPVHAVAMVLHVADRPTVHAVVALAPWIETGDPVSQRAGLGRFEARAAEVAHLGFDETFRLMWSLYLAYSEAGFRAGYLDVAQFTLTKAVR